MFWEAVGPPGPGLQTWEGLALVSLASAFGSKVWVSHTPEHKALLWGKPEERMELIVNTAHTDHLACTRDLLELFLKRPGSFWHQPEEARAILEDVHSPPGYGEMLARLVVRAN